MVYRYLISLISLYCCSAIGEAVVNPWSWKRQHPYRWAAKNSHAFCVYYTTKITWCNQVSV